MKRSQMHHLSTRLQKLLIGIVVLVLGLRFVKHLRGTDIQARVSAHRETLPEESLYGKRGQIDPRKYQTWVDMCYQRLAHDDRVATLALGIAIFSIGLLIAWVGRLLPIYLRSPQGYIVTIDLMLAFAWLRAASKNYVKRLNESRAIFAVSDQEFEALIDRWVRRIYDRKALLCWFLLVLLVVWTWATAKMYMHTTETRLNWFTNPPDHALPSEWYNEPQLFFKILIVDVYVLFCALVISTGARSVILHVLFVRELSKLPTVLGFSYVARILESLAWMGTKGALVGLFMVAFLVLVWYPRFSDAAIGLFALFSLLFVFLFGTPQLYFHKTLEKVKNGILERLELAYPGMAVGEEGLTSNRRSLQRLLTVEARLAQARDLRTWVYDLPTLIGVMAEYLLPLIYIFVGRLLEKLSHPLPR